MAYARPSRWMAGRWFAFTLFGMVVIAALALVLPAAQPIRAAEWSQLGGGPSHSAYNATESVLTRATVHGLELKWAKYLGGFIEWPPAVVGGVLYVPSSSQQVTAVRADTSKVLWTRAVDGEPLAPAVGHGMVHVAVNRTLYALDADSGAVRWKKTFPDAITAPVLDEGIVYLAGQGKIHALHADTGSPRWISPDLGGAVESSPAVSDGVVYAGAGNGRVYALRSTDGSRLWSFVNDPAKPISDPVVTDGTLYVVVDGYDVTALDAGTGVLLWSSGSDPYTSTPLVVGGGRVYCGWSRYSQIYDAASGKELLHGGLPGVPSGAPVFAGGVLYLPIDRDGEAGLAAIDAQTGDWLWQAKIGHPPLRWPRSPKVSLPAVASGVLYVGSEDGNLYAFTSHAKPRGLNESIGAPASRTLLRG